MNATRIAAALIAPIALYVTLIGCKSNVCTEMDCGQEGVTVTFDRDTWPDGLYTFDFDVDGEPFTCQVPVPVGELDARYCGDGGRVLLSIDPTNNLILDAFISGDQVEALEVTVTLGEEVEGTLSIEPDYDVTRPNGDDCPPSCKNAAHTLAL